MNNDLIRRSELFKAWDALDETQDPNLLIDAMIKETQDAPDVDAQPVRHGKWICEVEPNAVTASGRTVLVFRCSCCDFTWANKAMVFNYFRHCPNCGANMTRRS